jgi:hypothetical protein
MEQLTSVLGHNWLHDFMVQVPPAFAACESLHFIGLSLLFGSLLLVDLRGLGFFPGMPLLSLHKLVPVALLGFGINLLTGIAFVTYSPGTYFGNPAFQMKMALILLAGVNAVVFELMVFRPLRAGVPDAEHRALIKITSILSLLIWTCVLLAGRLIPFVKS